MAAPVLYAGYSSKILINGNTFYDCKRFTIRSSTDKLEVSNTQGALSGTGATANYKTYIFGLREAEVKLYTTTYDSANNMFQAPLTIADGAFYTNLRIYENGTSGQSWLFGNVMITDVEQEMDIDGLMPFTLTFCTTDSYSLPSS